MFRNYVAAALRNLARNRLYAAINIVGLAVALAAAILVGLFVRNELSFDRWIPNADRTYLLVAGMQAPGKPRVDYAVSPADFAGWMKLDFPEISDITRVSQDWAQITPGQDDKYQSNHLTYADPNFFNTLELPALYGDPGKALYSPDNVVITQSVARKYFHKDDAIGQTLYLRPATPYNNRDPERHAVRVAAVLRDFPSETNLTDDVFISSRVSFSPFIELDASPCPVCFGMNYVRTYLRLKPGASIDTIQRSIMESFARHKGAHESTVPGTRYFLTFAPVSTLHRRPDILEMQRPAVDPALIYAASGFGVLIVVIAGINFINLMTARASRRATEVGVRKVSGAERSDLVIQFMGESFLYVMVSLLIAMALVEQLLPPLNGFLDRAIRFDLSRDLGLIGDLAGLLIVVGLLAGAYPALVLSSFRPAAVLKGGLSQAKGSGTVRRALVVLQFSILIILVVTTGIIYRQTLFALNEGAHLNKDEVLGLWTGSAVFQAQVAALPGVRAATLCDFHALSDDETPSVMVRTDRGKALINLGSVEFGFFELYQIPLLAGRTFSVSHGGDKAVDITAPPQAAQTTPTTQQTKFLIRHVEINSAAMHELGFRSPAAAIGRRFYITNADSIVSDQPVEIIGVLPDFSIQSVRKRPPPMAYFIPPPFNSDFLSVRLAGGHIAETVKSIQALWLTSHPSPINVNLIDAYVKLQFTDLIRLTTLLAIIAGVALFVAALGLFGLAAFTAEQRTKEIGIRKAMGAERWDIVKLLIWSFTKPVLWANLIAWPVAYLLMRHWLSGFAYHIEPPLWMFPAAGGLAVVIAWLTVGAHALAVASAKPAKALRYE